MTNTIIRSTTLYFREGRSDKVYQAAIEFDEESVGFLVTFGYGRRGATLKTGTKTPKPVGLVQAERIHSKLVASKLAKGYAPGADGTPYRGTAAESDDTGIRPQLANPVEEGDVEELLESGFICLQEKLDGRRMLVRKDDSGITGINRRGLAVALPESIAGDARKLPGTFVIDGEAVGDTLHAFDLLERDGCDQRGRHLIDRLTELEDLLHDEFRESILPVPPAFTEKDKRALFKLLRQRDAEGVVFKAIYSAYRPGRPASGGYWLKFKFVETASFLVGINGSRAGKRSVPLELIDASGARVPAGNVTIPPNHSIPEPGGVVEVRYLYALEQSGSVYQPVYLGPRDDIPPGECTVDQLKFKPEQTAESVAH